MEKIPYELIARYFAGECNAEEIQQIEEWGSVYPEKMAEFSAIWKETVVPDFVPDVELALQKITKRIETHKKKSSKAHFLYIGSLAAAVIAISLLVTNIFDFNKQNQFPDSATLLTLNTGLDQSIEYELADGSKVWLNHSSSLSYPETFEGEQRVVYLEGEAFFDIAPNKDKPFIIYANGTETKVVGTSFGIKALPGGADVVVTVMSGIIDFSDVKDSNAIRLTVGEQAICIPKQAILEKNTNPDPNALAWKTKLINFQDTPLFEVARVITAAYNTSVETDSSISNLTISGTFNQLSLQELMQIIEITLQVEAKETAGGFMFTTK